MSGKRVILYSRVSGEEQMREGTSYEGQIRELKEHCKHKGYEIVAVVKEPESYTGDSFERPGLDRIREIVESSHVDYVISTNRDRLFRNKTYRDLWDMELQVYGTSFKSLNDVGGDSAEGQLAGWMQDAFSQYEKILIKNRMNRGKKNLTSDGNILPSRNPIYGFDFTEDRRGYVVDPVKMAVVERMFELVADGNSLGETCRRLTETALPPRGKKWSRTYVRKLIYDDVYLPHTHTELSEILSPEVLSRLDPDRMYGVWYYNRNRMKRWREPKMVDGVKTYPWRYETYTKPKSEWIGVPVESSGIDRELIERARVRLSENRRVSRSAGRFWELSGKMLTCGDCGYVLSNRWTERKLASGEKRVYRYYHCRSHNATTSNQNPCPSPKHLKAEEMERAVWSSVRETLTPEAIKAGYERAIEEERRRHAPTPPGRAEALSKEIEKAEGKKDRYWDMAAENLIDKASLKRKIEAQEQVIRTAREELKKMEKHEEHLERMKHQKEGLVEYFRSTTEDTLDNLTPQERHEIYTALQLKVEMVSADKFRVSGVLMPPDGVLKNVCVPSA